MESREVLREGVQAQTDVDQDNGRHPAPGQGAGRPCTNDFAPDEGRRVTLEEYWAKWYEAPYPDIDVSYEWNNGVLEAKPLANKPQLDLGNWFLDILRRYLETHEIAELINMETGFFMTMKDSEEPSATRRAVRKPDIGIILHSNPVSWGRIDQRSFEGVCDAVVEFLSDSTQVEVRRDTEEKKRDYALAGVKEYYILDPSGEHMHFYRLSAQESYVEIQPDGESVIRSGVLPAFQFRLDDLKRQPELEELALDDLYSGFVFPNYRASVVAAAAEAQRAEQEAASRQQAEERAASAEDRVKQLEAELARLRKRSA